MFKTITSSAFLLIMLLCCKKPSARFIAGDAGPAVPVVDTAVVVPVDTSTTGKTYLALGDSYTIGQSVGSSERFPVQTVALLNAQNIKFNQPEIIAQTGWTTQNLLSRLTNNPPTKGTYDIVSLLIGVNNQYQHRTQDEYRIQFTSLLLRAIQLAGNKNKRVFVLSIPDYSVTPYASGSNQAQIAMEIDSFNAINQSISLQYEVNYLDITGDTRQASTNLSLIASDGLHPSGSEYAIWAGKLAPMIKFALQ